MTPRIPFTSLNPQAVQHLQAVEGIVRQSGLEEKLLFLVKVRASQINGCAFCIDMHTKEARHIGETEQRLYGLSAWRETPYYTDRERAALEWTEAVTLLASTHVPDAAFDAVKAQFSESEIPHLTLAVTMINGWNRLAVSFRYEAGSYRVGMFKTAA